MKKSQRFALITGGSGGVGLATAKQLQNFGYTLMLVGRNHDRLMAAQHALSGAKIFTGDLTDPITVKNLFAKTLAAFGQIDAVVHAAEDFHSKAFVDFDDEDIERVAATVRMTLHINRAALQQMAKQSNGGVIVNVSSRAGILDDILGESVGYSTSKLAMSAISRAANKEKTASKVRFFTLCLGGVDTAMGRLAAEKRGVAFDPSTVLAPDEVATKIADFIVQPKKFNHDIWRHDKTEGLHSIHSRFGEPSH